MHYPHRPLFRRVVLRVFAGFFLALFACGAGLLLLQAVAAEATTVSYLLVGGLALLLAIGVFGVVRSGRWLRRLVSPIDDLLETTDRLASGDYAARAPDRGLPELRRLAAAINAMAGQLQRTAQSRRGFFADVTHELRTPLTILQGELEGMLDGVTPRSDERLVSMLEEIRHMSNLVEDLRTLSLADAGALDLRREPTDLAGFVNEVASSFRSEAGRAGVHIEVNADDSAPPAQVDPLRLREVVANLVVNSINASPRDGRIELGYAQQDGMHVVKVADEGRGIPADELTTLFDRFTKSADSEGSGLGLAIAKELVEAHGGSIDVESEVGKGTVVSVRLPGGG